MQFNNIKLSYFESHIISKGTLMDAVRFLDTRAAFGPLLFPPPPKNGIIVITINSGCWKIAASYLPICKAIIPVIAFAKWHFLSNHLIHGNRLKYSIGVFANIVTQ